MRIRDFVPSAPIFQTLPHDFATFGDLSSLRKQGVVKEQGPDPAGSAAQRVEIGRTQIPNLQSASGPPAVPKESCGTRSREDPREDSRRTARPQGKSRGETRSNLELASLQLERLFPPCTTCYETKERSKPSISSF